MISLILNVVIIVVLIVLAVIGFQAGIVRSLFAVLSGFVAIILAQNYPYQFGFNYYLIFTCSAIGVFLIGIFVAKILSFLYLSIFDKLLGVALGVFLWFVLSANFIIPTISQTTNNIEGKFATYVTDTSKKVLPMFGKYIPDFILNKKIEI